MAPLPSRPATPSLGLPCNSSPPARAAGLERRGRARCALPLIGLILLTGCYLPPLPAGFRLEIGDGTQPCLTWPDEPDGDCFKAEGYYSPTDRLAVTRRPYLYTIAHEVCHAWQHHCILEAGLVVNGSLEGWFLTPQGQSFLLMTAYVPRAHYNPLEDAAGVCAYRVLGLPMEHLTAGREAWARAWLR